MRARLPGTSGALTLLWLPTVATLACACGDDDGPVDARAPDAFVPGPAVAAPPEIPWLDDGAPPIAIAPCPDGWREVVDASGVTACDPYPEGGALDCPDGEAHFLGEPGCTAVGSPCPAGAFAAALPADATIVYVQPGASGDGMSPATPHGRLTDFSLAALPMGSVIALSRGAHPGPVRLGRGLTLQGACAAATLLSTSVPSDSEAVVTLTNSSGGLRDVTVGDSPRRGLEVVGPDAHGMLDGVVIARTETIAVACFEGQLTMRASVVRDTRSRSHDDALGRAVELWLGATAEVSRVIIERNKDMGLFATRDGTSVTSSDLVVRDTDAQTSDGRFGRGLNVQRGATVEVSRALLERNTLSAMYAGDMGTALTASLVVIRDTRELPTGSAGLGLDLEEGAVAELTRALLERNRDRGIRASGDGTSVTSSELVVLDTASRSSDGAGGVGLVSQFGASAEVANAVLERNVEIGVVASESASVTLRDIVVRDTESRASDGTFGRGLAVELGATADARRILLERNRELSVFAGAREEETPPGVTATLSDVVARDTEARARDGVGGAGLAVQSGATVDVVRASFDRSRESSIVAWHPGTSATLADVRMLDTRARACVETTCPGTPLGHAIAAYEGAALSLTRFAVAGAHTCGVHVAGDGQIDLSTGEVRGCSIGACVQVEGYDVDRLTAGVVFMDNDVNLQATTLPIPEPLGVF